MTYSSVCGLALLVACWCSSSLPIDARNAPVQGYDENELDDLDTDSLIQTYSHVSRQPPDQNLKHVFPAAAQHSMHTAIAEEKLQGRRKDTAAADMAQQQNVMTGGPAARPGRTLHDDSFASPLALMSVVQTPPSGTASWIASLAPQFVLVMYVIFATGTVLFISHGVFIRAPPNLKIASMKLQYPEAEAYKKNVFNWLWMGWATEWILRWGTVADSSKTKIQPDDIPLTDPGDECDANHLRLEDIWKEELDRNGVEQASLLKTVSRFVTYKRLLMVVVWNAFYEAFLYLAPPLALERVTRLLTYMYARRMQGDPLTPEELVAPSLLFILIFTGIPVLMGISNSISSMLGARMGVQVTGALSCLAFNKALRLSMSLDEEALKSFSYKTRAHQLALSETPLQDEGAVMDLYTLPKRFNLVQLIERDIEVNIMSIPTALARMAVMLPVMLTLLGMLIARIGMGFFLPCMVTVAELCLSLLFSDKLRDRTGQFYGLTGYRLEFIQQILAGIRFIKGFGGEGLMLAKMKDIRSKEMALLDSYYHWHFCNFTVAAVFPKIYTIASLFGVYWVVGSRMDPAIIFSLVPLLASMQSAMGIVLQLIPTVVLSLPSGRRCEAFLKQPEAPASTGLSKVAAMQRDQWVSRWPAAPRMNTLSVKGSFGWREFDEPVLNDINLVVPHGKLVAIMGQVGSGKSTLLHAILGELTPHADARINIPQKIAYASQVAHLFEGTVRENVLLGEPFDEKRYQQAIFAACLNPDFEVLPGGDCAPIGSRGISLSGGQRARVSLARAAYSRGAGVVMMDDPFGSVDVVTANHLMQHLVLSPLLADRTRILVCQPCAERMQHFDWAVIMANGRIAVQGSPEEVMTTSEYRQLLCTQQAQNPSGVTGPGHVSGYTSKGKSEKVSYVALREEECQGRATWSCIVYFYKKGGWKAMTACIALYMVKNICDMKGQGVLASWMTAGSMHHAGADKHAVVPAIYMMWFIEYFALSTLFWVLCWIGGHVWTLTLSRNVFTQVLHRILYAPIDKFFDKTPSGQIMNRMTNDIMNVDLNVFLRMCTSLGTLWSLLVPLVYVHLMCPLWFTVACIPFYYLVIALICLYWKTMVPLRYLMTTTRSGIGDEVCEAEHLNPSVRAYQMQGYRLRKLALNVRRSICADFVGTVVLNRWLTNRLFLLGGIFTTLLSLMVLWAPTSLSIGTASLCLMTLYCIITMSEQYLSCGALAQYDIITINRVYEYAKSLPKEAPFELQTDAPFRSILVNLHRSRLDNLAWRCEENLHYIFNEITGKDVLQQVPGKNEFLPVPGCTLAVLDIENDSLKKTYPWHRIVSINHKQGAKDMAESLCSLSVTNLSLEIQSGWLADGVKVEFKDLRAGYGDIPRDVLHNINLTIPRKWKVGIAGTTGCGKSTTLLCLLRMMEPRSGRIYLNNVDIQTLGLQTLRRAMGLVSQDPVLLQGSLRFNLDPFDQHDDGDIWKALEHVHLADFFRRQGRRCEELGFEVQGDGRNLSYGQRQLLALARNMIMKPKLLLLDECTSAIDPYTQELVQATIRAAFPDSTLIVVAHRLETISDFDMIVVMDNGRVVEKGSASELMQIPDGLFATMGSMRGLRPGL